MTHPCIPFQKISSLGFPLRSFQNLPGQSLADLGMPGDRFLSLTIGPYVVLATVSQKAPPELSESPLELPPLHSTSVHQYVYKSKSSSKTSTERWEGCGGGVFRGRSSVPVDLDYARSDLTKYAVLGIIRVDDGEA